MLHTVSTECGYEVLAFPDPGVCPLHTLAHCQCPRSTICADMVISDVNMLSVSGLDFIEDLLHKRSDPVFWKSLFGPHPYGIRGGAKQFSRLSNEKNISVSSNFTEADHQENRKRTG